MSDLLIAVIFMFVLIVVYVINNRSVDCKVVYVYQGDTENNEECINTSTEDTKIEVNEIKDHIIKVFKSDYDNKRELLVNLLRYLQMHEDTSDFLENHKIIHKYIFNMP